IGTATAANGLAFIASNDDFFANFAKWGASQGAGSSGAPSSNYLRAAWTTGLIPGFDSAIGFQLWTGTSAVDASATNPPASLTGSPFITGVVDTKASAIDAQMMGDVGSMPLLVVASWAKAPTGAANTNPNFFNQGAYDRSSFNIAAELGVIPNKATLQLGFRNAKSGGAIDGPGLTTGGNATDNAILVGATYNLALNVRLELTYSKYSGDVYNSNYSIAPGYMGDNMTMLDLAFGL
ncbi:MAG: hypothetical protein WCA63_08260, partial [Gallionella sp.]